MENFRKILSNPIFNEEEKHHISGVTQFIENINRLKDNEHFFDKNGICKLEVEINRTNASSHIEDRTNISVISNLKAFDVNDERIPDITTLLYNEIGFVSSPLQKLSSKYLPGKPQFRYANYSINTTNEISSQLKSALITEDLLKKIDIALLETELDRTLNVSESKIQTKRKI